jgi:hypothetical protein
MREGLMRWTRCDPMADLFSRYAHCIEPGCTEAGQAEAIEDSAMNHAAAFL